MKKNFWPFVMPALTTTNKLQIILDPDKSDNFLVYIVTIVISVNKKVIKNEQYKISIMNP